MARSSAGAIPDDEYSNWREEDAAYTTSSPDPNVLGLYRGPRPGPGEGEWGRPEAEAPPPAAPRFRDVAASARGAVDLGVRGLQRLLGLQSTGAIPSPDDDVQHTAGAQRLAQGQGAATSEEVAAVDRVTGVDQMGIQDEGMKNLIRIEKAVNWHLMRGEKDKAEAVAASLLMYGAGKVRQAGMFAAVALQEYQESGDPADLRNASQAMKLAHQLIPDGFNIEIDVDPRTRQAVVTALDQDGKPQKHIVDPQAIPGLLQKAMDGSAYWDSIMRIGHPQIANTRESRAAASEEAAARRDAANLEWDRRNQIQQEQVIEKEDRAAARKLWETNYELDVGKSEGERRKIADDQFYADWAERYDAAEGAEKQALLTEGLQYRYENTRDRQDAVADEDLTATAAGMEDQFGEDLPALTGIARVIARKNDALDAVGAMNVTRALITEPTVTPMPDGTLDVGGYSLVFNPQLLPQLSALRKKYRAQ